MLRDARTRRTLLFSLLFLAWTGFGYAGYLAYPSRLALFYAICGPLFTCGIVWTFLDLRGHIRTETKRTAPTDTPIVEHHWLCTDPLCGRCQGYYAGLTFSFMVVLTLHAKILALLRGHQASPRTLGGVGLGIFVLTTPLAGAADSILRTKTSLRGPSSLRRKIKTLLGLTSGLSLGIVAISVLLGLQPS